MPPKDPVQKFLDGKLANCVSWLIKQADVYLADTEDTRNTVKTRLNNFLHDEKMRDMATNTMVLNGIVTQSPQAAYFLEQIRSAYLDLNDEQRAVAIEQGLRETRTVLTTALQVLDTLEANKENLALDARRLGAYVEIFFGPLLDAAKKQRTMIEKQKLEDE